MWNRKEKESVEQLKRDHAVCLRTLKDRNADEAREYKDRLAEKDREILTLKKTKELDIEGAVSTVRKEFEAKTIELSEAVAVAKETLSGKEAHIDALKSERYRMEKEVSEMRTLLIELAKKNAEVVRPEIGKHEIKFVGMPYVSEAKGE